MNNLIGLNGPIGSGKDTVARLLVDINKEYIIRKFAEIPKAIVADFTGKTLMDIEDRSQKEMPLGGIFLGYSLRDLTKIISNDMFKPIFGDDIWVNRLLQDYDTALSGVRSRRCKVENKKVDIDVLNKHIVMLDHMYFHNPEFNIINDELIIDLDYDYEDVLVYYKEKIEPKWVIADVRFKNEAKAIKDRGGVVVKINRNVNKSTDKTENDLNDWDFDVEIDNYGSIFDLKNEIIKKLCG